MQYDIIIMEPGQEESILPMSSQKNNGICLPAALHPHPFQPGRSGRPGRTSGSNLLSSHR